MLTLHFRRLTRYSNPNECTCGCGGCEGNITLNAQKFSEILGALRPLDTLDVDIDDGGLADLTTSGGHFSMQTLPAQDFPVLKIMPWTTTFTLPAKTLRYLLTMTAFAMAPKDIRYFLMGVLFVVEGAKLMLSQQTHIDLHTVKLKSMVSIRKQRLRRLFHVKLSVNYFAFSLKTIRRLLSTLAIHKLDQFCRN